jgi:hypothetical protein
MSVYCSEDAFFHTKSPVDDRDRIEYSSSIYQEHGAWADPRIALRLALSLLKQQLHLLWMRNLLIQCLLSRLQ